MSWHSDDTGGRAARRDPWPDDEALARDLAAALGEQPLVGRVTAAADTAFAVHRGLLALREELDTELLLLTLVHDSSTEDRLAAVRDRSGQPPRTLVFQGDGVGVELEVGDRSVEGQLIPAGAGHVTLRRPDGDVADVDTDEVGYFRIDTRPQGPVCLVCTTGVGTCVTEWLSW
ncbi:hypothetical protein [Cellulomonas shaoxiangyii]|uniref:Uncharacterized protein n=1 Tax=Cellulomonas shaoxiangyii TaxID=2566013 RepID=A0A4P7SFC9_9CELL|nr:hypothetical protein [Cellulomonas shaoxiangyii]QCB92889.1 hypothetical protein E5225_04305 [Cellulomonas shaoxiangyii]TGY81344.1 hypothetical protein E5226_14415 [Cellulomonas shaoxiangyii]